MAKKEEKPQLLLRGGMRFLRYVIAGCAVGLYFYLTSGSPEEFASPAIIGVAMGVIGGFGKMARTKWGFDWLPF